jgi:hypothetical protein
LFGTGENVSVSRFALNRKINLSEFIKLNLFILIQDRGKCERFAFRFEPKINLSKFIKLNLFIFVQDGGKCERFAFRFIPKKNVSETGAP